VKCQNCGADVPEVSRFCLSCGKEIPPPQKIEIPVEEDDGPSVGAILCFGLSFMLFFFGLVPILLGSWEGAALMFAVGTIPVIIGFLIIRAEKKPRVIEKPSKPEPVVKLKCHYCGSLNDQTSNRCEACGATL